MLRKSTLLLAFWIAACSMAYCSEKAKSESSHTERAVAELTSKLGLSKQQSQSLLVIMNKANADMLKLSASKSSNESKAKAQQAIAVDSSTKMMALLNAEQRKKLAAMMQPRTTQRPVQQGSLHGGSFADRLQTNLNRLSLSKAQKAKTDAIMKDFEKKHKALRQDAKLAPNQRKAKADDLKEATMSKLKVVLTPEQEKKLKEFMHVSMGKAQQGSKTPPSKR